MSNKKVKLAQIKSSDDSNSGAPLLLLQINGGDSLGVMVQPYGLTSRPPDNTYAVVLPINGEESNKMAIAVDLAGRMKDLQPGESALENTVTGAFVYLDFNGDITISSPGSNVNITAANTVSITAANVNITADVAITGAFTVNGKNVSDTHTHGGVTPGGGTTGGVS